MVALVGLLPVTWIILSPSDLSTWFEPIATPPLELPKSSPKSYDLSNLGRHFGDAAKSYFWSLGSRSGATWFIFCPSNLTSARTPSRLMMPHGCVGWVAPGDLLEFLLIQVRRVCTRTPLNFWRFPIAPHPLGTTQKVAPNHTI